MSEYKNGLNSMGNMSVGKDDISHDPVTGRAVFIDDARYDADAVYKAKVDELIKQGFHKVSEGSGGGSSDFSTAQVTVTGGTASNAFPIYDNGTITVRYMTNESATVVIGADGLNVRPPDDYASISGAIQSLGRAGYLITGDCTITVGDGGGSNV